MRRYSSIGDKRGVLPSDFSVAAWVPAHASSTAPAPPCPCTPFGYAAHFRVVLISRDGLLCNCNQFELYWNTGSNLPDLLGEREHSSVVDILSPESFHGVLLACHGLVPAAAVSCSTPVDENILLNLLKYIKHWSVGLTSRNSWFSSSCRSTIFFLRNFRISRSM